MKKKHLIILHIVFWAIFVGMPILSVHMHGPDVPYRYYVRLYVSAVFDIFTFYIAYLFINPSILFKGNRKSLLLIIIFIFLLAFLRVASTLIVYYFAHVQLQMTNVSAGVFIEEIVDSFLFVVFAIFIKMSLSWVNSEKQKAELQAQTRTSEIAQLRSQINPHFLFNTLNNIYSLVCRKSDAAAPAVMKLSEIMRYVLYDTDIDMVPLDKEVSYLESFIELQQLRLNTGDFIKFEVIGETWNKLIAPMLLIPFVENAFKHGNKNVLSPGIIIKLTAQKNKIIFEVINFTKKQNEENKDRVGGIGLNNIKRRLELIYHDKHKLDISEKEDLYSIKLEIIE